MAFWKMDGFDVIPRTPRSTQRSSSPLVIQPRRRLSSHGLWFCSLCRSWSRVTGVGLSGGRSTPGVGRSDKDKCARTGGGALARRGRGRRSESPAPEGGGRSAARGEPRGGAGRHVVGGEPELLEDDLAWRAGPEVVDADRVVGVARPSEGDAGL